MLGAFHTPPESPENVQPGSADRQQAGPSRQHEAGKRLWRKNKDRLKKEVEKLTKLLEKERKRSDKYRKKYKRSNKSEVLYREVSCMCSTKKQLNCQCFNTLHFSFHKPAPKAPNAPIVPVEREVEREGIDWESENVIGSWN
ncbi:unnamed protein product [Arctogadus glacialis]